MCPKDVDGMTNSEDPDKTAPQSMSQSLIWVCTVCSDLLYSNQCYNKTCYKQVHVSQMVLNDMIIYRMLWGGVK